MSKIVWDEIGKRFYETGVDHGVLFVQDAGGSYETGVAWNGLTGVTQSPSGGDENKIYADNIKYVGLRAAEDFGATVEAYTYPDEFALCDGSAQPVPGVTIGQQARRSFGMSYRTRIGNDTEFEDHGYKIHLIYNASVSPSEKAYATINDSPDAIQFSWELTTTPIAVTGYKPTAHVEIDSTKFVTDTAKAKLTAFEAILYGSDGASAADARLPLPNEVFTLLTVSAG